jgi:hypothetical protein
MSISREVVCPLAYVETHSRSREFCRPSFFECLTHRLSCDTFSTMPGSTALSASSFKDQPLRPRGGSEQVPGRSGALRHAPPKRALVEPIGLRAFQRALQSSLVEAFARPLDCGSRGLKHQGDLSVAERLWPGVFDYAWALSRMRARFNLRAGAVPEEMSLCKYPRCCLLSSARYFFFIAALLQRRISLRISRSIQTSNHH